MFSPCGVENFDHALLAVYDEEFAICVFDGGIVGADKDVSNELYGQSGLADASAYVGKGRKTGNMLVSIGCLGFPRSI